MTNHFKNCTLHAEEVYIIIVVGRVAHIFSLVSSVVTKTTVAQDIHQRRIFDFRPPSKSIAFTLDWVTILTWDFFPAKIELLIDDLKLVSSIYLKRFACGNKLKFDLAKKVQFLICSFHGFWDFPKNT